MGVLDINNEFYVELLCPNFIKFNILLFAWGARKDYPCLPPYAL